MPLTKGISGPTTTRSILFSTIIFFILLKLRRFASKFVAIVLVPAFPGIQKTLFIFLTQKIFDIMHVLFHTSNNCNIHKEFIIYNYYMFKTKQN